MSRRRADDEQDTRTAILDAAERLVQRRGFNGFSYADVAEELRVTKAALHYHFPGKAELGEALIIRYAERFVAALEQIDLRETDAADKLRGYGDLYLEVLSQGRMCLCGMLAAEYETLPDPMRETVVRFFDANNNWLASLLELGRAQGSLVFVGSSEEAAQMIIGALEGAMLVARPYGSTARFETAAARLIADFSRPSPDGPVGLPRADPDSYQTV